MNSFLPGSAEAIPAVAPYSTLAREVAIMAGRFAALLRERFSDQPEALSGALEFLDFRYRQVCGAKPAQHWRDGLASRLQEEPDAPLQRLRDAFSLPDEIIELMVFAGLADEHEGFADIFRTLHPQTQPLPTLGLAAQLLTKTTAERNAQRQLLEAGIARATGLFRIDDEQPFYLRSLRLAEQLWPVLHSIDAWPESLLPQSLYAERAGLALWLEGQDVKNAVTLLRAMAPHSLLVSAESKTIAAERAAVLLEAAGRPFLVFDQAQDLDRVQQRLLQLHCLARSATPLLILERRETPTPTAQPLTHLESYPAPIVIAGVTGAVHAHERRPLFSVRIEALNSAALRTMWRELLPELGAHADQLAARFPLDPAEARVIAQDLGHLYQRQQNALTAHAVAEAVRARSSSVLTGSVQLIRPQADWSQLVLPPAQVKQMHDAVDRLLLQSRVLDDWHFLRGRRGARGVRMLFAGPSGTGKTLSAEVLANALDVDVLQVDLSRVVSKWIGETEKNLAQVFLAAERARAVLFFDEADSLFGKRTEVSDANDRYANLETAYLLSRLERYEGLAILATNFRQNIDAAFSRRLEFIVEFTEPGFDERLRLWQCHIPPHAPLDKNVSVEELAALFPIVGGHIRNAAVAAAFLAARDSAPISRAHFIEAIRREYEKSGKAYREISLQ